MTGLVHPPIEDFATLSAFATPLHSLDLSTIAPFTAQDLSQFATAAPLHAPPPWPSQFSPPPQPPPPLSSSELQHHGIAAAAASADNSDNSSSCSKAGAQSHCSGDSGMADVATATGCAAASTALLLPMLSLPVTAASSSQDWLPALSHSAIPGDVPFFDALPLPDDGAAAATAVPSLPDAFALPPPPPTTANRQPALVPFFDLPPALAQIAPPPEPQPVAAAAASLPLLPPQPHSLTSLSSTSSSATTVCGGTEKSAPPSAAPAKRKLPSPLLASSSATASTTPATTPTPPTELSADQQHDLQLQLQQQLQHAQQQQRRQQLEQQRHQQGQQQRSQQPLKQEDVLEKAAQTGAASQKSGTGSAGVKTSQTALDKAAERRRRNRESSSRCYYNRKRVIEKLSHQLGDQKRRLAALYDRALELRHENARLKRDVVTLGIALPAASHSAAARRPDAAVQLTGYLNLLQNAPGTFASASAAAPSQT